MPAIQNIQLKIED
jgi:hypothetical protein